MRKPYENKSAYDPGRFRFKLTFFEQGYTETESAGSVSVYTQLITTMAVQEKLSERSQLAVEAGASVLNQDCWYVIRQRNDFSPAKDMIISCNGQTYVIRAVIPLDVPVKYIKMLCVKSDVNLTT